MLTWVGVSLWWRSGPSREALSGARAAPGAEAQFRPDDLVPAREAEDEPVAVARDAAEPGLLPGTREEASARPAGPAAPVRGQLVHAEDLSPLLARKLLLLASDGNRVSEFVMTDALGAFTSTRAFPGGNLRVWIKDPRTKETLAQDEARFDPEREDVWRVLVSLGDDPGGAAGDEAIVRLRVVDLGGKPCSSVWLRFVPEGGTPRLEETWTSELGQIELTLAPGQYRVGGGATSARLEPRRVSLVAGENDLGDWLLPVPATTAHLAGRVLASSASQVPYAMVICRDLSNQREFFLQISDDMHAPPGEAHFEFDGLVPGPYRLSLLDIAGGEYLPRSLDVVAPADGILFHASDKRPRWFRLDVRCKDGAPVEDVHVLGSARGHWFGMGSRSREVPGCMEEWLVVAQGCRPARGQFRGDAAVDEYDEDLGADVSIVHVELDPGHGEVLLCQDVEGESPLCSFFDAAVGAPLAGVELRVDGVAVSTSDAHGLLVLDAARPPEKVELGKPGWRLLERRDEEGMPLALFARQSP